LQQVVQLLRSLRAEFATNQEDLNNGIMAIDSKLRDVLGTRSGGSSYSQSPSVWPASPRARAGSDTASVTGTPADTGAAANPPPDADAEAKRVYDQAYLDLTRNAPWPCSVPQYLAQPDRNGRQRAVLDRRVLPPSRTSTPPSEFLRVPEMNERATSARRTLESATYLQLETTPPPGAT
jgi:hypothetical protein